MVLKRSIVFNSTFRWICFGRHLLWFISEPLQLIKRLSLHGVTAKLLLYNNNFDLVDWSCVLNLGFVWESNIMCGFESRTTYVCPWRWFFFWTGEFGNIILGQQLYFGYCLYRLLSHKTTLSYNKSLLKGSGHYW